MPLLPAALPRFAALAAIGLVGAQPLSAGNESRYEAFPAGEDQFEVIAAFSEAAIYWCGASIYVQSTLSRPVTQRIYVWREPSPSAARPGKTSVRFGLRPPPGADAVNLLTNDVDVIGNSLTVAQAKGGCSERSASG